MMSWYIYSSMFYSEYKDTISMMYPSPSIFDFINFCMSHKATVKRIKRRSGK